MIARPVTDRYLLDEELNADPYSYFAELCDHDPVHWSSIHRSWLVTGYEQVVACLHEPAVSSDRIQPTLERTPAGLLSEDEVRAFGILSRWMVFVDPPDHRRLRRVFRDVFAPRQVERARPLAEAVARELLAAALARGEPADLVADFARPLPAIVSARWLGVPAEDDAAFLARASHVGDLILGAAQGEDEYRRSQRSLLELFDYLGGLVERRRAEPHDDLISAALASGQVGETVGDHEFVAMLTHLAFAGGETTGNLIANGVRSLLLHPDQLAVLRADPGRAPSAVEELLRFDGPSKMSIRHVAADFPLRGQGIRKGDRLFLVTAAANRDRRHIADPHRLDVTRRPNPHLGFGQGGHFCLGAALARLIAATAIEVLVREAPALALVGEGGGWQLSLLNRSLRALPVRFRAR